MWIAVALFGAGFGGVAPLVPAVVGERFGTEHLSKITGAVMIGAFAGAAIGPWMGGFLFDVFGNYALALATATLFALVALTITLRLPSPRPPVR
jgi:MFS family permease